tara:strand:+ start:366 stop:1658 length:1293 start_codon:yes stop_codon:yes gene_type:complete
MGSTYTDNGGIEKIGLGEQAGAWGTTTNNNFDIIDRLVNGVGAITLSGTTHTLTTSDGSLSDGMFKVLVLGGSPSGTNTITISPNNADKLYFVKNASGQSVIFSQGSGANVTILNGNGAIIFADGAGSGAAVTDLTALFVNSQAIDGAVIGGTTPAAGTFTTLTANTSILPDASGGADIGSTSAEFGDIYIADDKKIYFGSGQDVSMEYDEDGTDTLLISGGDITIADDKKLNFGTDKDVSIEYDEDGNNTMLISGAVVFADGSTDVDIASHDTSNGLKLGGTLVTATAAELNIMDGVTATTAELNYTDGVSSNIQTQLNTKHDAVGNGLQEDDATTVALKNSFISNASAAVSTGTATSFTASTYPTFISGRTTSTGGGTFTVTVGGSGSTLDMRDGDGGTYDVFSTFLPAGASISGNEFTYIAVQMRPG